MTRAVLGLSLAAIVLAGYTLLGNHGQNLRSTAPLASKSSIAPVSTQTEKISPDISAASSNLKQQESILRRYQMGDYDSALKEAEHLLENSEISPELRTWVEKQLPALLNSVGWLRLQGADCEKALTYFERALKLQQTPEGLKGSALCYAKLKQYLAAQDFFQQYFEVVNHDPQMRLAFADVLESRSDFAAALRQLEEDPKASPELQAALKVERTKMRKKQLESSHQIVAHSDHFTMTYRASEHEALENFVLNETLEPALHDFVDRLGFKAPSAPLEIVLYSDENFTNIMTNGPDWAQGIYDGRMRIPVNQDMIAGRHRDLLARVLRHELVHALLAEMTESTAIPSWFNEGLAQRLECGLQTCAQKVSQPLLKGGWLDAEALTKPYFALAELEARRSYYQSLFLIEIIESELAFETPILQLVRNLPRRGSIDSDRILQPLNIRFSDLHQLAEKRWLH